MKKSMAQFSMVVIAAVTLLALMGYSRPAPDDAREYMVVIRTNPEKMQEEVNKKLTEGWNLQGGVASGIGWSQALSK